MGQLVHIDVSGPVGTLTLNRPERHNSLVPELLAQMAEGLATLGRRPGLRVLVLQANGRSFSTGGDVRGFYEQGDQVGVYAARLVGQLNDVIVTMLDFPVPIVTAVQGAVTGGSLGFLLASDIVLLAPEAGITPYYSVVGFSPDGGWTALLPEVIGAKRTAEVLVRNLTVSASQAVEWGLASRMVPADRLRDESAAAAADIAAMQPGSLHRTRRLLRAAYDDAAARLEAEQREFCEQVTTAEARRGMANFLAGRQP